MSKAEDGGREPSTLVEETLAQPGYRARVRSLSTLKDRCTSTLAAAGIAPFSHDGRGSDRVQVYAPDVDNYPQVDVNATWSGTSFAAPMVSGAAAVALQRYPGATPAFVRSHLVSATRGVHDLKGRRVRGGRIDLSLVVQERSQNP